MVEQEETLSECQHHWLIDSPNGPTSVGVCKICGSHQEFPNSLGAAGWERDTPSERMVQSSRLATEEGETPPPV